MFKKYVSIIFVSIFASALKAEKVAYTLTFIENSREIFVESSGYCTSYEEGMKKIQESAQDTFKYGEPGENDTYQNYIPLIESTINQFISQKLGKNTIEREITKPEIESVAVEWATTNPAIKVRLEARCDTPFVLTIYKAGLKPHYFLFRTQSQLNDKAREILATEKNLDSKSKQKLEEILAHPECIKGHFTVTLNEIPSLLKPALVCTAAGACYYVYKHPEVTQNLWSSFSNTALSWYDKFLNYFSTK